MTRFPKIQVLRMVFIIIGLSTLFPWVDPDSSFIRLLFRLSAKNTFPRTDLMLDAHANFSGLHEINLADFKSVFPENGRYLVDLERQYFGDLDYIQFLRMRHLRSFCRRYWLKFKSLDIKSITLFNPYPCYECCIPKTGFLFSTLFPQLKVFSYEISHFFL